MTELRTDAPYKGLAPFTADDAQYFFGRNLERNLLDAHVRGNRLTVLYGASGAGKSSLLQAGLAAHLRLVAAENRMRQRPPGVAIAVMSSWERDPQLGILRVAAAAVTEALGVEQVDPAVDETRFVETLQAWTERLNGTLILLLDQFEDYLAIRRRGRTEPRFDAELAELAEAPGLRVHVLISVQEEWLARLDFLEEYLFNWFAGAIRLEHLAEKSAEEAIVRPLETWNEMLGLSPAESYRAEPELVAALLEKSNDESDPLATAYLQLVLRRLWDEERKLQSRVLRKSTLDALGGVDTVFSNHVVTALSRLSETQRLNAAEILRRLVTPGGSRQSLSAEQLGDPEIVETLRLLADANVRIVRAVAGTDRAVRYEVFHQVLVTPIHNWLAALDAEQVQRERRKTRRRTASTIAVSVVAIVAMLAVIALRRMYRLEAQREQAARAGVLIQQADNLRDRQFDLALLLALYAHDHGGEDGARRFLARNLGSSSALGAFIGWSDAAITDLTTSPDGAQIIAANANGSVQMWSRRGHDAPAPPQRLDWEAVTRVAFSRDGTTVAIAAPDGTTRLRSLIDSLFPIASFSTPSASTVALSADASVLAVGDSNGSVALYRQPFGLATNRFAVTDKSIEAIEFNPDGKAIVIATSDGGVRLVALARPHPSTQLAPRETAYYVTFSPNGRMIAAGGVDGTLHLWSGAGDQWSHKSLETQGGTIGAIAFTSNGEFVAVGGASGAIGVWNPLASAHVQSFTGHDSPVRSIVFARDGTLISGQEDGSVRAWSNPMLLTEAVARDETSLRKRACSVANRNLSKIEWMRYIGSDMPYTRVCPDLPAGAGVGGSQ